MAEGVLVVFGVVFFRVLGLQPHAQKVIGVGARGPVPTFFSDVGRSRSMKRYSETVLIERGLLRG